MILPIVKVPARVLTTPVKKIDKITSKIRKLVQDMEETLQVQTDPEGVGLAATQVGFGIALFIIRPDDTKPARAFINPEIIKMSQKIAKTKSKNEILEGCLSLPHYYGPLKREQSVTVKYQDETGKELVEEFRGFNAQIILHEIDHLNGVLFVDRLLEQKKKLYKLLPSDEWEEVTLI